MATLQALTTSNQYAIASGQGHIATEAVWLVCDYSQYGCQPEATPPTLVNPVGTNGYGQDQQARKPGSIGNDGYWHEFTWTFASDGPGASQHMAFDILSTFKSGGPVSVRTLDPNTDDGGAGGRSFKYATYDAEMEAPKVTQRVRSFGGYIISIKFKAATRRVAP